jgi:hypothetical protein
VCVGLKELCKNSMLATSASSFDKWYYTGCHSKPKNSHVILLPPYYCSAQLYYS